jgi:adenosylcobinamide-GDP ribazoletransferase
MNDFLTALSFLTILPVNLKEAPARGALGRAAGWFPWIGAFIGLAAAAILWCLRMVLPEALAAVLAAALWIAFSGGLHLDGLADCCDGLLNASAPERRLEIMKDPRVGTFGAIGLIIAFSLRAVSLYYLGAAAWLALPLAGALSRWTLLLAVQQPLARPAGMGADFAAGYSKKQMLPASLVVLALTVLNGWRGLSALTAVLLTTLAVIRLARVRIGGITGDVFGALIESSELAVLLVSCLR